MPAAITPELAPFVAERAPHIVFTDAMREFSRKVVGDENNPYRIAQKLFAAVDRIPWAGAREYSTITNISDYALHAGHADCGQQTLLLMTLLRLNGIPARWQSGMVYSDGDYDNLHDWGWLYLAPYGWVPMDVTTGRLDDADPQSRGSTSAGWMPTASRSTTTTAATGAGQAAFPVRNRGPATRRSGVERRQPLLRPMGLRIRMRRSCRGERQRTQIDQHNHKHSSGRGNEQAELAQARALHGDGDVPGVHGVRRRMRSECAMARWSGGRASRRRRSRSRNPETGFSRTVTADADGNYRFAFLPVGNYTLEASKAARASANRQRHGQPRHRHDGQPGRCGAVRRSKRCRWSASRIVTAST